jgi:hypothetical protein
MMTREQWDDLYIKLYDAYDYCGNTYNETYRQQIGMILDQLIDTQPPRIKTS